MLQPPRSGSAWGLLPKYPCGEDNTGPASRRAFLFVQAQPPGLTVAAGPCPAATASRCSCGTATRKRKARLPRACVNKAGFRLSWRFRF
jgi:hypothetical protein